MRATKQFRTDSQSARRKLIIVAMTALLLPATAATRCVQASEAGYLGYDPASNYHGNNAQQQAAEQAQARAQAIDAALAAQQQEDQQITQDVQNGLSQLANTINQQDQQNQNNDNNQNSDSQQQGSGGYNSGDSSNSDNSGTSADSQAYQEQQAAAQQQAAQAAAAAYQAQQTQQLAQDNQQYDSLYGNLAPGAGVNEIDFGQAGQPPAPQGPTFIPGDDPAGTGFLGTLIYPSPAQGQAPNPPDSATQQPQPPAQNYTPANINSVNPPDQQDSASQQAITTTSLATAAQQLADSAQGSGANLTATDSVNPPDQQDTANQQTTTPTSLATAVQQISSMVNSPTEATASAGPQAASNVNAGNGIYCPGGAWGPWSATSTPGLEFRAKVDSGFPDSSGRRVVLAEFRNNTNQELSFSAVVLGPGDDGPCIDGYDIGPGKHQTGWDYCHVNCNAAGQVLSTTIRAKIINLKRGPG